MKKEKKYKSAADAAASEDGVTDPRFASFTTDPRFRLPSKSQTRTKIDKRFSRMLKDDDFTNTAKVDRYGRKLSNNGKKQALRRLYQPEEDEEGSGEVDDEDVEVEVDEVVEKELKRADMGYDAARGGGFSSSEEDEEDEEDEEEDEEDGGVVVEEVEDFPDLQTEQNGVPVGEVTTRIAVVNLDWDNIRAVDLMAVFSSFVRTGGRIRKVSVFPSEFGKERMEREELEGPPKEVFVKKYQADDEEEKMDSGDDSEEEDDDEVEEKIKKELIQEDDGQEFDNAALRQYQVERLRYYYAVMVCSDKETAYQIYESTDGTEYLSSANFFDLRFIPDEVDFDEKPRDECEKVPSGYKPTDFATDALRHSKVKLTWDAEDAERKDVIKRAFSGSRAEIGENDLRAYLGSDSSEDDDEGEQVEERKDAPKLTKRELARQKMRAALGLPDEPTSPKSNLIKPVPVGDIQITFAPGLSANEKGKVFTNAPIEEETTADAYIRKERERKARRKEKAKATREGTALLDDKENDTVKAKTTAALTEAMSPPVQAGVEADQGFEDSFFTTDEAAKSKVSKAQRKEARKAKRAAREAEERATASERAKLELLMADEANGEGKHLDHFDINEIARVDKISKRKRGKKGKKGDEGQEGEAENRRGLLQKGFKMDVHDPRFSAVFERHEYAIDPSNPKFKATEGMKALLEEGRGRRKRKTVDGEAEGEGGRLRGDTTRGNRGQGGKGEREGNGSGIGHGNGHGDGKQDLTSLVQSLKRKKVKVRK